MLLEITANGQEFEVDVTANQMYCTPKDQDDWEKVGDMYDTELAQALVVQYWKKRWEIEKIEPPKPFPPIPQTLITPTAETPPGWYGKVGEDGRVFFLGPISAGSPGGFYRLEDLPAFHLELLGKYHELLAKLAKFEEKKEEGKVLSFWLKTYDNYNRLSEREFAANERDVAYSAFRGCVESGSYYFAQMGGRTTEGNIVLNEWRKPPTE